MSLRREVMNAAQASLQAMTPHRLVLRGLQEPAQLGDTQLRQGVFSLVAEGLGSFVGHLQREAEAGTLDFAVVAYGLAKESAGTLGVETLEEQLEDELLAWCRAVKPTPLDAIYPKRVTYSRGIDAPLAWLVINFEAYYV